MIKTFLFDLGNVLVNFSHQIMVDQIAALTESDPVDIARILQESNLQHRFERGEIDEAGFHAEFQERIRATVDREDLLVAGSDIFWPQPSMEPIVQRLKESGFRLVLLSNTCRSHFAWVRRRFAVLEPFDDYVLSFEVGAVKPEAAIFERALERIECEPAECLYTDDISAYVAAGASHGLNAEVFTNAENFRRAVERFGVQL